jgi:hypothetical protein
MQQSSAEPQIKVQTEIVLMTRTTLPLRRWSIDPRFSITYLAVTVKNISDDDLPLSLKFQHSNGSPADDHQCRIGVPDSTTSNDPASPEDVVTFAESFGGFNSTFTDVSSGGVTSLPPGAEKVLTFSTTKGYMQLVATTANNARAYLSIKSLNNLTATETGESVRTDTALSYTTFPEVVDHSGTIASGGVAQTIMAANPARTYLFIENTSDTDMWFNYTTTAGVGGTSIKIGAGAAYENPNAFCPTGAISLYCASGSKSFTAKER